ncbi:MAG: YdcF family protein [Eggerthellaceae bacterium]|nr:YdcF family protein [Eggerthellaceae bacterium]MBQ9044153.1 YdcF family protein [Eggerthellaceae bacterium]
MAIALAVIGVACALYGVAIMAVGSGTWFFAFWYVLAAVFLAAAWAVHAGWWEGLPVAAKRVVEVVIGVLLVVYVATLGLQLKDFNDEGEPNLDYLIVLGAQVRDDGPSMVLRLRLDTAYDYLVANENTVCVVSGGQGFNEPVPEAEAMAAYLVDRGIDPSRIIREGESESTEQNIANSMAFFNPETARVGIVTNNFHVFRGTTLARNAGIAHVCGIAAPTSPFYLPNNMTRESFGIVKGFLTGALRLS